MPKQEMIPKGFICKNSDNSQMGKTVYMRHRLREVAHGLGGYDII